MSEARIEVEQLERLAFLVMAPEEQIRIEKTFEFVSQSHIESTIRRRISQYEEPDPERFDDLSRWADAELGPLMDRIALECISWEMMILEAANAEPRYALELEEFYSGCLDRR